MNIFDSEPCDDNIKKFRITCGEVYILTNIIECCKNIFSLELIDSNKLDLNKLHNIIPQLMITVKPLIMNEIIADMYYFYLSSFNEKIDNYIKVNDNLKLSVNDFCVISRKKCTNGFDDTSQQYKVYIYLKKELLLHPHSQQAM
jgi:hypothetical protein